MNRITNMGNGTILTSTVVPTEQLDFMYEIGFQDATTDLEFDRNLWSFQVAGSHGWLKGYMDGRVAIEATA
jgi:hypothetical protein